MASTKLKWGDVAVIRDCADAKFLNVLPSFQNDSVRNRMPVSLIGGGGELGNLKP
jgi:hypothetical protein